MAAAVTEARQQQQRAAHAEQELAATIQRAERTERELGAAVARAQKAVVEAQQARHNELAVQTRLDALQRCAPSGPKQHPIDCIKNMDVLFEALVMVELSC